LAEALIFSKFEGASMDPREYFSAVVAQQYAYAVERASGDLLSQPALSISITIDGDGGGVYGMRAHGRSYEYVEGAIDGADMQVKVGIEDWRLTVKHGGTEALIDYFERRKIQVVKGLRGAVTLELTRPDGNLFQTTTIFGQQAEPAVTLMMTTDDYAAMARGDLNGQMAFMMGKLKFEGSLPLLMAIGALAGK
jgi:putative sterol carrier protein